MKFKKPVAGLPRGVGISKTTNGAGVEFWRVRLGRKFTGAGAVKRDFRTLDEARAWIFGDAATLRASVPGVVQLKQQSGAAAFELTHRQLTEAAAVFRQLAGASLSDAVGFYLRFHPRGGESKTLCEAIAALLDAKRAAGRSEPYIRALGLCSPRQGLWLRGCPRLAPACGCFRPQGKRRAGLLWFRAHSAGGCFS